MESPKDIAISYLSVVQKKHMEIFTEKGLNIFDCVKIKGVKLVTVHVTSKELPFEVVDDIESMFWNHGKEK